MHLEAVDLLVIERVAADDRFGGEERAAAFSQTRVGRERAMLREPRAYRALRNVDVDPATDGLLRLCERVTEVEGGDRFEDGLERIGLVFAGCSGREVVQAFGAFVDL